MSGTGPSVLALSVDATSLMLSIGMLLALYRLVRGPSLPDRVVALDLFFMLAIGLIATFSVETTERTLLDAAIVLALVAFLGTVVIARYLERTVRR